MLTPSRLGLAIRRRRLTRRDFARALGVDERTVRRWLEGESEPTADNLDKAAALLGFPVDFFEAHDLEEVDPSQPSFRSRRASKRLLSAATQSASIAFEIERILVDELRFRLPPLDIPDLPQAYIRCPESAATWVREQWGLRDRPIKSVVGLLERKGVRVFSLPSDIIEGRVSAFCVENQRGTPFVLLNTRDAFSGERTRFDAAHELGHIVMHRSVHELGNGEGPEDEADAFAAAFLIPEGSVRRVAHLVEPSIEALQTLKLRWGVSVSALARRLRDLDIFTTRQYGRVNIELSRFGRKKEPNPIPGEGSRMLPRILRDLRNEGGVSLLAGLARMRVDEMNEYLFGLALVPVESATNPSRRQGPTASGKPQLTLV